jgi:hypothetical protein
MGIRLVQTCCGDLAVIAPEESSAVACRQPDDLGISDTFVHQTGQSRPHRARHSGAALGSACRVGEPSGGLGWCEPNEVVLCPASTQTPHVRAVNILTIFRPSLVIRIGRRDIKV